MRALRSNRGRAELVAQPVPDALAGEALIRMTRACVTATEVELLRGLFEFDGVLGHQFVGVVESVNEIEDNRSDLVGRRVVGSTDAVCGKCDMCLAGLRMHCRHRSVLGVRGRDGCLADYFTLPVENLVAVPDGVDDDHAVFAHQVASALQAARQLTIEGRPYITVLGDGPLGLITAQVMSKLNASVRVVGRYSEKLELCEKWGIKHRHVDDIGRRADQDIVVDCTGAASGLILAMRLVRPRGTIVVKSLVAPESCGPTPVDLSPLIDHEITLLGSRFGPVPQAINTIAAEEVQVINLVERRMSLADGPAILDAAARPGAKCVLVEP